MPRLEPAMADMNTEKTDAAAFDPYYVWLAIPPEEQPPDHYRLLAVRRFEGNTEVISNAADARMAHLKTYQTGKRSAICQKLLNEISGAVSCLLSAEKKAAYDAKLKAADKAKAPTAGGLGSSPEIAPRAVAKATLATATAVPAAVVAAAAPPARSGKPAPIPVAQVAAPTAEAQPSAAIVQPQIHAEPRPAVKRRSSSTLPILMIGGGALTIGIVIGVVMLMSGQKPEQVVEKAPTPPAKIETPTPEEKKTPSETPPPTTNTGTSGTTESSDTRVAWQYDGGLLYRSSRTRWRELGAGVHNFTEQARTPEYVELFDKTRELTARLYADRMEWSRSGGAWTREHEGGKFIPRPSDETITTLTAAAVRPADNRSQWRNTTGDVYRLVQPGVWEYNGSQGVHRFAERARTPQYVELFDASRNSVTRLFGGHLENSLDGSEFKRGAGDGSFVPPTNSVATNTTNPPSTGNPINTSGNPSNPPAANGNDVRMRSFGVGQRGPTPGWSVENLPVLVFDGDRTVEMPLDPTYSDGLGSFHLGFWIKLDKNSETFTPKQSYYQVAACRADPGTTPIWRVRVGPPKETTSDDRMVNWDLVLFGRSFAIDMPLYDDRWHYVGLVKQASDVNGEQQRCTVTHTLDGGTVATVRGSARNPSTFAANRSLLHVGAESAPPNAEGTAALLKGFSGSVASLRLLKQPWFVSGTLPPPNSLNLQGGEFRNGGVAWEFTGQGNVIRDVGPGGNQTTSASLPWQRTTVEWFVPESRPPSKSITLDDASSPPPGNNPNNPNNTPNVAQATKSPVPPAADLEKAKKSVDETYGDRFTKAKGEQRTAIIREMFTAGKNTADPAECYALLEKARTGAIRAGDLATAFGAMEEIIGRYEVDVPALKLETLSAVSKLTLQPNDKDLVGVEVIALASEMVAKERFSDAEAACDVLQTITVRASADMKKQSKEARAMVTVAKKRWEAATAAKTKLAADPADAQANFARGMYLYFEQRERNESLDLLMKSGVKEIADAAAVEKAERAKGSQATVEMGDKWYAAMNAADDYKFDMQCRTCELYNIAGSSAQGLEQARSQKRFEELEKLIEDSGKTPRGYMLGGVTDVSKLPERTTGLVGRIMIPDKNGKPKDAAIYVKSGTQSTGYTYPNIQEERMGELLRFLGVPAAQIVLEGTVQLDVASTVRIQHSCGDSSAATHYLYIDDKEFSMTAGRQAAGDYSKYSSNKSVQLPAGLHTIRFVLNVTPNDRFYMSFYTLDAGNEGGGGFMRTVRLFATKQQQAANLKLKTKLEQVLD